MVLAPKHFAILLTGFSLAAHGAESAPKKSAQQKSAQPDIRFLEYLGTAEGDDENWTDVRADVEMPAEVPAEAIEPALPSKANAKPAKPVVERK